MLIDYVIINIISDMYDSMKGKEIRTLLAVLATGIVSAFILAFGMLRIYNPEGTYTAASLLLAPDGAFTLNYTEPAAKGRNGTHFRFQSLSFTRYVDDKREWLTTELTRSQYDALYSLIKGDISLADPSSDIIGRFAKGHPASLRLMVQETSGEGGTGKGRPFTEAAFADDGDHYRINLRHSGNDTVWVYFYHPGIYKQLTSLLGGKP